MSGDMEKYETCPHCGPHFPTSSGWNYEAQQCSRCGLDRLRIRPRVVKNPLRLQRERVAELEAVLASLTSKDREQVLLDSAACIEKQDKRIAELEQENARLREAAREVRDAKAGHFNLPLSVATAIDKLAALEAGDG